MKQQTKPYFLLFAMLIYVGSVCISAVPEISILERFAFWMLGEDTDLGYHNFYWVLSMIVLVMTHQIFIDPSLSENVITVTIIVVLFIAMTVFSVIAAYVDPYLLKSPVFFISIVVISSTLLNNASYRKYGRRCRLVSLTDLENKEMVDFWHTVIFAVGLGLAFVSI